MVITALFRVPNRCDGTINSLNHHANPSPVSRWPAQPVGCQRPQAHQSPRPAAVANIAINILIVYAFTKLPLATVYTAVFAKPYIAAILGAALFAQAIGIHRMIAITIGFSGVLIAFQPWQQSFEPLMIIVLAALPIVITIMFLSTRWITEGSLLAIGFWPTFASGLFNAFLAFPDLQTVDLFSAAVMTGGAASIVCGVITVSKAFQMGDSAAVSPMVYTQMVWGIILGYIVFHDAPSLWMITGSAIIIISGIYLVYRENKANHMTKVI